jgi:hypothetical protein
MGGGERERETIFCLRTVSEPKNFEPFDEERKLKIMVHV